MLDNFNYRFTDIMKDKIDSLNARLAETLRSRGYNEAFVQERLFTIREVVIVASMIERETANGSESYDIASVIYNRLTNPVSYPYLQIDATVIYGMGGSRIDPATGRVTTIYDASALEQPRPSNPDAVLNGIAALPGSENVLVTGKLWNQMYEVRLVG